MGYEWRDVSPVVHVKVSRHNSERDAEDDRLADEIRDRLHEYAQELICEPKYDGLTTLLDG